MAQIDTSFAQTAEQRLAKAREKQRLRDAATAQANAAREAAIARRTTAPATSATTPATAPATGAAIQPATNAPVAAVTPTQPASQRRKRSRSESKGLRQRFSEFIGGVQGERNQVLDSAIDDSVNATETGRQRSKVK